uniref:Ig-like domain-containing protein n=1 Tax=Anopheles coluzzii TaxID=1518534 RepID=A0A8W7P9D2_ANOCL
MHSDNAAPPTSIQIQGYSQHAKVEVREGEELTLTCVVPNARPAAQIVWYRANVEYKSNTIETKSAETEDHRYTATSKLQLQPTAEDDYIDYTCQARHQAIPEDRPMQSTVQLSVLYPPGVPYIEGYAPGEVIRRGQHVQLACRSRGGNPPAQLICKAVPPGPPIISGYTEGSIITVGTRQKIMCTSSGGNPLATLVWYKNDKKDEKAQKPPHHHHQPTQYAGTLYGRANFIGFSLLVSPFELFPSGHHPVTVWKKHRNDKR